MKSDGQTFLFFVKTYDNICRIIGMGHKNEPKGIRLFRKTGEPEGAIIPITSARGSMDHLGIFLLAMRPSGGSRGGSQETAG